MAVFALLELLLEAASHTERRQGVHAAAGNVRIHCLATLLCDTITLSSEKASIQRSPKMTGEVSVILSAGFRRVRYLV